MQCFVHGNLAAAAVCKKCGKAMCVDCSAFANHSGLCPVCRRDTVESGLRRIRSIKRVRVFIALILSAFILAGIASAYFFLYKNPLIFCAAAIVPAVFIILAANLKRLAVSRQSLLANLAQINHALGKSPMQAGVINPFNQYQDLEACKPPRPAGHWACKCGAQNPAALTYCAQCGVINPAAGSQLSFVEFEDEDIPEYKAGGAEEAENGAISEPIVESGETELPAGGASEGAGAPVEQKSADTAAQTEEIAPQQDVDELRLAANTLITEDDIFEGQITFKEMLEEILRELSMPPEKPRRPLPARAALPRRPANAEGRGQKRAEGREPAAASKEPPKTDARTKPAQKTTAKKPPAKPVEPLPRALTEEEKKVEKERAEIRRELGKLREQINELYKTNK